MIVQCNLSQLRKQVQKVVAMLAVLLMVMANAWANNLQITMGTNPLVGQNTIAKFKLVHFNLSWENSWRTADKETNWDAAWVFVKYRKLATTVWNHATLNYVDGTAVNDGHTEAVGSTINTSSDGKGAFIYRNAPGIGNVNFSGIKLRWNYGVDGLTDYDSVEVCVFGIEMVYIPAGSYYLGSGGSGSGEFYTYPSTTTPYQVLNEGAINVGSTAGYLNYTTGGWIGDGVGPIPAAYPKGTTAMYCMKYEITQKQYVDFLNKLQRAQQTPRAAYNTQGLYINTGTTTPAFLNGIRVLADDGINARVYGCDLNNNGIYDEANDGQWKANNYLAWGDYVAFADWAALRPMGELEFEKICRGSVLLPVVDEYVWGNTNIFQATTVNNVGAGNEVVINANANANYGNHASVQGPLRGGIFAVGSTSRQKSGATYYGVMEMGGNVAEITVSVGTAGGRAFVGVHGDGNISAAGAADQVGWPTTTASYGWRGGSWFDAWTSGSSLRLRTSDRHFAAMFNAWGNNRGSYIGGRCVRTLP